MNLQHSPTESIEKFKFAICAAGLEPPNTINPGKLQRFPGKGKSQSNTAGWCILFDDLKGGVFGDYSSEIKGHWQVNGGKEHSAEEQTAFIKRCEAERKQRDVELQQQHEETAVKAKEILTAATGDMTHIPMLF